jgi:ATP-dependent exoDNAse (exonuclease V) beta subunit
MLADELDRERSDRSLGTLVHRLFQHETSATDPAAVLQRAKQLQRDTDDVTGTEHDLAERAAAMYLAMRARPDVAEALTSGRTFYEVPFSFRVTSQTEAQAVDSIIRGQIDAVVVPPSGPVTVVEFKTGQPRPEHQNQVDIYRAALAAAWPGREVETRLFYFQAGNEAR